MTIQFLPDNSSLAQEVLPSIWAGYKMPPCRPITEAVDQTSQAFQMGYHLSKKEADKISSCFWTESVHDFCVQFLGKDLTDEDHGKILKIANEFIKNRTVIRIDESETDLIKLLAAKVVLNAHQRANHEMSHACFLNERNMLPKENIFMLQKGESPIFYGKDEFDRAEKLNNNVQGVPEERLLESFSNWINRSGTRYIPAFNQMGKLMNDMKYTNALILKKSLESYTEEQRRFRLRHHPRPKRQIWHSREE